MNLLDGARASLTSVASIPRNDDGPLFPAPWAATAFGMTLILHERGHFTWSQWAQRLGAVINARPASASGVTEEYWHCWVVALEAILSDANLVDEAELQRLRDAWREAALTTPHGEPITLGEKVANMLSR